MYDKPAIHHSIIFPFQWIICALSEFPDEKASGSDQSLPARISLPKYLTARFSDDQTAALLHHFMMPAADLQLCTTGCAVQKFSAASHLGNGNIMRSLVRSAKCPYDISPPGTVTALSAVEYHIHYMGHLVRDRIPHHLLPVFEDSFHIEFQVENIFSPFGHAGYPTGFDENYRQLRIRYIES